MSFKLTLSRPVEIDGASVSVITLREADMNDIINAKLDILHPEKMMPEQINRLIANLSNWTPEQTGKMKPKDWAKCSEYALSVF